jgi:hypothetical protein
MGAVGKRIYNNVNGFKVFCSPHSLYFRVGIVGSFVIMFLTFLATQVVDWKVLTIFLSVFAVFGLLTDYFEDKEIPRNQVLKLFRKFIDLRAQYYLFPFLYSLVSGEWLVFFAVALNMFFYEVMLRVGNKIIEKQQQKSALH